MAASRQGVALPQRHILNNASEQAKQKLKMVNKLRTAAFIIEQSRYQVSGNSQEVQTWEGGVLAKASELYSHVINATGELR
jgi:hypothetical protein